MPQVRFLYLKNWLFSPFPSQQRALKRSRLAYVKSILVLLVTLYVAPDLVFAAGSTCEQGLMRASCWDMPSQLGSTLERGAPEEKGVGPLGE